MAAPITFGNAPIRPHLSPIAPIRPQLGASGDTMGALGTNWERKDQSQSDFLHT